MQAENMSSMQRNYQTLRQRLPPLSLCHVVQTIIRLMEADTVVNYGNEF